MCVRIRKLEALTITLPELTPPVAASRIRGMGKSRSWFAASLLCRPAKFGCRGYPLPASGANPWQPRRSERDIGNSKLQGALTTLHMRGMPDVQYSTRTALPQLRAWPLFLRSRSSASTIRTCRLRPQGRSRSRFGSVLVFVHIPILL